MNFGFFRLSCCKKSAVAENVHSKVNNTEESVTNNRDMRSVTSDSNSVCDSDENTTRLSQNSNVEIFDRCFYPGYEFRVICLKKENQDFRVPYIESESSESSGSCFFDCESTDNNSISAGASVESWKTEG